MSKPITQILHSFLLLVLIGTYGSIVYTIKTAPVETPLPRITPTSALGLSATEIIPDTGWSLVRLGLEQRLLTLYNDQDQPIESVHIWRIDQKYFRLDVDFDETPKSLEAWQKKTNASLVMNGGYFSIANEKYSPDGLVVINGKTYGHSFDGFGGMLAVQGGRASLRWLVEKPYDPDERLQAALQSFPMLIKPGGRLGFGPEREDKVRARRTVIAQDKKGRILLIVAPQGYFTLHQLSVYLSKSDLDLDVAVNLDGGGSTGILVVDPKEVIPSKVLLPFVVLVYDR